MGARVATFTGRCGDVYGEVCVHVMSLLHPQCDAGTGTWCIGGGSHVPCATLEIRGPSDQDE
eukprot:scaffold88678_cov31-Tisochrysis_lutea.AAC.6